MQAYSTVSKEQIEEVQRYRDWSTLPNVAVERIWSFLTSTLHSSEAASVRLVCKQWKRSISAAIEELTIDLTTQPDYYQILPCLKRVVFAGPFNQKQASENSIAKLRQLLQGLEQCKSLRELDITSVPLQFEQANADVIDNVEVVRVLPKLTALTHLKLPSKIPKTFEGVAEALDHLKQLKKVSFPRSKLRRLAIDSILSCKNADSIQLQVHSRKVLRRVAQLHQLKGLNLYSLSKDVGEEAFADCLKGLVHLELLRIDFSDQFRLTHVGVVALGNLTNLRQLHLNGLDTAEFDMNMDDMSQLCQLQRLTYLELSALGNVRSSLASFLPHLSQLLSLSISLVHPESWYNLLPTTLTSLWLSHDQHLDDLVPFQELTTLKELSITCCTRIEDSALKKLGMLTKLEKFQVVETKVKGKAFQNFWVMPHLTHLALGPSIDAKGFQAVSQVVTNLRLLKLIDCNDLDRLEGIQQLQYLSRIELMRCNSLQDNQLRKNLSSLHNLEILLFHSGTCIKNRLMSGDCLRSLCFLPKLRHLEVNRFCGGTVDNFQGLPKMLRFIVAQKITRISLRGAIKMTDDALAPLATLSHCLVNLDLSGCSSLKGRGLANLSHMQKLKYLDLSLCDSLGRDAAWILCGEPVRERHIWGLNEVFSVAIQVVKSIVTSWTSTSGQSQTCGQCGKAHSFSSSCLCNGGYEVMRVHHDLPHFEQERGLENKPNRANLSRRGSRSMLCRKACTDEECVSVCANEDGQEADIKILPQLAFLAFKRNPQNSNSFGPNFSCLTRLTGLEYVDLDCQLSVNDDLIKQMSKTLNRLSCLSVRNCKSISKNSEDYLKKFKNLKELKVSDTGLVKREGMEKLESLLPRAVVHV